MGGVRDHITAAPHILLGARRDKILKQCIYVIVQMNPFERDRHQLPLEDLLTNGADVVSGP